MKKQALTLALVLAAFPALHAQNLLSNGSFETGDLTGWSTNGIIVDDSDNFFNVVPTEGTYLGIMTGDGYLEQTLSLEIGQTYDVSYSFDLQVNGANTRTATTSVTLNGVTPAEYTSSTYNETQEGWNTISFSFVADAEATTIRFIGDISTASQADLYFDNFSVVPEPSAYAMLTGLLGLGYVMVKRRR